MKMLLLIVTGAALALASVTTPVALAAAPANDARTAPQALSVPQKVSGTTVDATLEDGEVVSNCDAQSKNSVWFSLSNVSGRVAATLDAAGDLDADIDVYVRSRSQTTFVDCSLTGNNGLGLVAFDAKAANEYLIRVSQRRNSVAGDFTLNLVRAQDPADGPGKRLPARGVSDTVDWARNPSDAYSIKMNSGVTYRLNLASASDSRCVSGTLYSPDRATRRRVSCGDGYTLFTPGRGEGGRYYVIVRAETRTIGTQRYRLQAARAQSDDLSPGRFWGKGRTGGHLSGSHIDVVDVFNWDLDRAAHVDLKVSSRIDVSIELLTPTGRHLASGDEGEISRRLSPGTYFVVVGAYSGGSGSYRLSRLERTITSTSVSFNGAANATVSPGSSVSVSARVSPAVSGKVEITLDRFDAVHGWQFDRVIKGFVSGGSFSASFLPGGVGRWRARAAYLGTHTAKTSTSKRAHLRIQR